MEQDKTRYRKVNPEKLPPAEFLKKELIKFMPRTKLSGNEEHILNSRFGLNGQEILSTKALAKYYNVEVYRMMKIENKTLAKVVGNVY